jgi:hypothetical protein
MLGQSVFFPQPAEIEEECEELARAARALKADRERRAEYEKHFWEWVDFRKEMTGLTEQEILDSVREPGYTNRQARGTNVTR